MDTNEKEDEDDDDENEKEKKDDDDEDDDAKDESEDDDDSDDYHVIEETAKNCHYCNKHLDKVFYLRRFTICDLYNLETKTSFLDELWMTNLKLFRSVK